VIAGAELHPTVKTIPQLRGPANALLREFVMANERLPMPLANADYDLLRWFYEINNRYLCEA
jgi:hypothetical protein